MIIGGAGALLLAGTFVETAPDVTRFLSNALLVGLILHVIGVLLGEAVARHGSSNAAAAAEVLTKGRYAGAFWGSITVGSIVPVAILLGTAGAAAPPVAAALALAGLLLYEHAFVMAGQSVPVS